MAAGDSSGLLDLFPVSIFLSGLFVMGFLSWMRPTGRVSFYNAKDNSLRLTKKIGKSGSKEQTTLADLCRSATPTKCQLNPFLFNGHLQTAWTTMKFDNVPVYYKRRVLQANTPMLTGHFAVDFVTEPYEVPQDGPRTDPERKYTQPSGLPERTAFFTEEEFAALPSDDSKPMLVVLHGLSGGSHELYLRHVLHPLIADGTWEACVVNSRGCAQTNISSGVLYNARATWDVRQAVQWLRQMFPNRPLFGIGFSLGANILANRLFEAHVDAVSKNPRINVEEVRSITYLHEFDRAVQCASWGYPTEGAYYRDAASIDTMLNIRIPFFVVQAEDDPIASANALPWQEIKQNPYGVMMTTSWGGHLGWFELGGDRWFVKPVNNFLNLMAKDIDLDTPFVVENPERLPGHIPNHPDPSKEPDTAPKPDFNPIRRKLDMKLAVSK
ncbi:hypothetical protein ATERTT37_006457 [Aspergillus terreus]